MDVLHLSIDLMDDLRELAVFRFQGIETLIEGNGEPVGIDTHHLSGYLNGIVKLKQGEFELDRLPFGNLSGGPDEQAIGTDVLDHIPVSSLTDGILGDDIGSAA
jgi:hypothetical protein